MMLPCISKRSRLLGPDGNRCRDLILALVVGRILDPGYKLVAASGVPGQGQLDRPHEITISVALPPIARKPFGGGGSLGWALLAASAGH
jgi:hypothetical protein